jgi:outer membrane protein assembly factor BamE (lipoprotein component of BamABCDE complex)
MIDRNTYIGILIGASIVILFLLLAASNSNQSNRSLERRVTALENRVTQLEGGSQLNQPRATPQTSNPWRSLQNGMTMDQVRDLLGEPIYVRSSSSFTYWFYGEDMSSQTVTFLNQRVNGWSE